MSGPKVLVATVLVTVIALGVGVAALAQSQFPPVQSGFWQGMMGQAGGGMMGNGYFNQGNYRYGPMHEYMEEVFAEKLNLSEEEIEEKLTNGETMWSIAQAAGLTEEEIFDLMLEARSEALDRAVESGALTQEQAEWMIQHMSQMPGYGGFGPGGCHGGYGNYGSQSEEWQRMPGWRWNTPSE